MGSVSAEIASLEAQRAELQAVLHSELFTRAPALAHLLSYLGEKTFAGQSDQIKEYTIAVEVFARQASFDQDADSIVRVQANRLRKRLAEYYAGPGAAHPIHISIPVGQYVPRFESVPGAAADSPEEAIPIPAEPPSLASRRGRLLLFIVAGLVVLLAAVLLVRSLRHSTNAPAPSGPAAANAVTAAPVGLPVGDEIRILAGAHADYVDRAGKLWSADRYFSGGTPVRSGVQHIWRTQDREIYRTSRQGDFTYDVPLKPGAYELRLHFAESFYGPEEQGGGGEGSRLMVVKVNGRPLLNAFDVVADAGGSRTADVKVFTDIAPAGDGFLHLVFSSMQGGRAMLSAIEILPGMRGHMRPLRMVARQSAYYSNDSRWWSPDNYFQGGQLALDSRPALATDDPELYEGERWGNFSYAVPVAPGSYTVVLHFVERRFGPANHNGDNSQSNGQAAASRLFNVFCNGRLIVKELDLLREAGENRPLLRRITGLEPNAQGKLRLDFVPLRDYATLSAIEVLPE